MKKFAVISYDDDQQQTFWDFVMAESSDEAKEKVNDARPYAIAVDAIQPEELEEMAYKLHSRRVDLIEQAWAKFVEESQ